MALLSWEKKKTLSKRQYPGAANCGGKRFPDLDGGDGPGEGVDGNSGTPRSNKVEKKGGFHHLTIAESQNRMTRGRYGKESNRIPTQKDRKKDQKYKSACPLSL